MAIPINPLAPHFPHQLSQEALRQSKEEFRLMVESVQDYAIFMLDPEGFILTWNRGAERIKGYRPEEIIGSHFSRFYSDPDIKAGKPEWELREAVEKGRVEDRGWRLKKDGSKFWAHVTLTALRDKTGELRGFSKVTRDMTEQRIAEEALRQSEERFRLMVENVRDYAIFMLTPEGRVASWNIGAKRIKGYEASEIIGQHFSKFYPEEDKGKPARKLEEAAATGRAYDEGWRLKKDGTRFWASVTITALRDKNGELMGFVKVTRDMTEKKTAEEVLERKVLERTRDLRHMNKELEQFAYVASHDLQEPLRMVATYADLLSLRVSNKLDAEEKDYLRYAVEGAERAQRLIRELLQFSSIGFRTKMIEAADFNQIIKSVLTNLKLMRDEKKAEITVSPLPILEVEKAQIQQLFQNLIGNALKYSPSPAKIHISAHQEMNQWVFSVDDEGIGIAPEHRQKIFELFRRLHTKEEYPGTGLGLAICKKIVERHRGRIWVESNGERGSSFKFSLPVQ